MTRLHQLPAHSDGPAAAHATLRHDACLIAEEVAADTGEDRGELADGANVHYVRVLTGQAASVPSSRAFVDQVFGKHPHVDDAKLIVSELVTNATRHTNSQRAGGQVVVAIAYDGDTSRIAVIDDGGVNIPDFTRPQPDDQAIGGRGLHLVAAIAQRHGWHDGARGRRVVWAELGPHPAGKPG